MLSSSIAKRYASALYAIGKQDNSLLEFERQLGQIGDLVKNTHDLREAYMNPILPVEAKYRIIDAVFDDGSFDRKILDFLKLLADKERTPYLPLIVEEFTNIVDVDRNAVAATVITAVELDETRLGNLKARLEKQTGKTVRIATKIDPKIIGGAVVHLGDTVIDGSIRYNLDLMRQHLRQGGIGAYTQ